MNTHAFTHHAKAVDSPQPPTSSSAQTEQNPALDLLNISKSDASTQINESVTPAVLKPILTALGAKIGKSKARITLDFAAPLSAIVSDLTSLFMDGKNPLTSSLSYISIGFNTAGVTDSLI